MARPTDRSLYDTEGRDKTEVFLRDLGADEVVIASVNDYIDDREVQGRIARLRTFAQENPTIVLGALSALLVGGAAAVAVRKATKKSAAAPRKRTATKARTSSKRTLIEPHPGDKRYIRRDAKGRIKESDDVSRSLSADARRRSKTRTKSGSGDKGDR